jgi:hypothetical protein
MKLSAAPSDQIAAELMARGAAFILVIEDSDGLHVYSPPQIDGDANKRSAGLFKLVRDCNHLEEHDLMAGS